MSAKIILSDGVLHVHVCDVGDGKPVVALLQHIRATASGVTVDEALEELASKLASMATQIRLQKGQMEVNEP